MIIKNSDMNLNLLVSILLLMIFLGYSEVNAFQSENVLVHTIDGLIPAIAIDKKIDNSLLLMGYDLKMNVPKSDKLIDVSDRKLMIQSKMTILIYWTVLDKLKNTMKLSFRSDSQYAGVDFFKYTLGKAEINLSQNRQIGEVIVNKIEFNLLEMLGFDKDELLLIIDIQTGEEQISIPLESFIFDNAAAHYTLLDHLMRDKSYSTYIDEFNKFYSFRNETDYDMTEELLESIKIIKGYLPQDDSTILAEAISLYMSNNYLLAENKFEALKERGTKLKEVHYYLGNIYFQRNEDDKAYLEYMEFTKNYVVDFFVLRRMMNILRKNNRKDEIDDLMSFAQKKYPWTTWRGIANMLWKGSSVYQKMGLPEGKVLFTINAVGSTDKNILPIVTVTLNGTEIHMITIDSIDKKSYSFEAIVSEGDNELKLTYINDRGNRGVFIHELEIRYIEFY